MYSFSAKSHLVCVNLEVLRKLCEKLRFFGENWHKFFTTAGHDGRDISTLELAKLFHISEHTPPSREEGTSDGSRGGKSKADSFWGTRGQVRKYFE